MDFSRIDRLRSCFGALGIDGFYTEDPVNLLYLTGFRCSESALVAGAGGAVFVTDFRHLEDAGAALKGVEIGEVEQGAGCLREAVRRAAALGIGVLGFEGGKMPWSLARNLIDLRGERGAKSVEGLVENLRAVKDENEIAAIRKALEIAERAFVRLRMEMRPGVTEKRLSDLLETFLREEGASKGGFDPAVLFGERSSLPHGIPGDRKLKSREPVLVDWGALYEGYHSDSTRMAYPGGPPAKFAEIHEIVREAQSLAMAATKPGARMSDIDSAARDHIARAGFGREFGHGLGHGVGLMIHEPPRVSRLSGETAVPGMVFTIEPGIYIQDTGGVRIEDMVLVTRTGCERLGSLPVSIEGATLKA